MPYCNLSIIKEKRYFMKYDVIIIGAGASGIMAAITAARQNKSVLLIDKENKLGKKIYATGNGKCNFTNAYMKKECFFGNEELSNNIFGVFSGKNVIDFFNKIGVLSYEKNGYYYPNSNQASSIVTALELELMRCGVTICLNSSVLEIKAIKDVRPCDSISEYIIKGYTIENVADVSSAGLEKNKKISKDNKHNKSSNSKRNSNKSNNNAVTQKRMFSYECKSLIFATGLLASPKLGSDGSSFELIKKLGHTFTSILPVLCGFYCKGNAFKKMAGVRVKGQISILDNGKVLNKNTGEIQITDYGISGIPVFQVSHSISELLLSKKTVMGEIDFLTDISAENLKQCLKNNALILPDKKEFKYILNGILPDKMWNELFNYAKMDSSFTKKGIIKRNMSLEKTINDMINKLVDSIKHYQVIIEKSRGYEFAQACSGGINSNEIDANTLESALYNNLFFAGELLDVDGICGGYNLQWAWTSGYIAGLNAAK